MRKIIIVSFILSLLILTSFVNTVYATSTSYDFGFEGCVAGDLQMITTGLPVGSDNIFTSTVIVDGAYEGVSSSGQRTGTRCFHDWGGQCQFNASYSTSNYMTTFTMYLYTVSGGCTVYFYNKSTSHLLVKMFFSAVPSKSCYYDETDTLIQYDTFASSVYHKVGFQINNSIGDCGYIYNSAIEGGSSRNPTYIANLERIDQIVITTGGQNIYYDDWEWTISTELPETSGTPSCSFPTGDIIGQHIYGVGSEFTSTSARIIEWDYNLKLTGTLTGLCVYIGADQTNAHLSDPTDLELSDYNLYLNGVLIGNPDCIKPWGAYGVMIFHFDIDVDAETIVFELNSQQKYNGVFYWNIITTSSLSPDLDGDGDGTMKYQDPAGWVANGLCDGTGWGRDNYYVLYIENLNPIIPPDEPHDYLDIQGWYNKNATGVKQYRKYLDNVVVFATVDSLINTRTVELNTVEGNTAIPFVDYDINWIIPLGDLYAVQDGCNITLTDAGNVVLSVPFNIIGDPTGVAQNYSIWTEPVTSYGLEPYETFYRYINPSGYEGIIAYFYHSEQSDLDDAIWYTYIENGTTGSFTTNPSTFEYNNYWRLFVKNPSSNYFQVASCTHFLLSTYGVNFISTEPEQPKKSIEFQIYGTHRFPLTDVKVTLNNKFIQNVGNDPVFNFPYTINVAGSYILKLVLYMSNGTTIELDSYTFSISEGGGGGGTTPVDLIFTNIGNTALGSIVGMIITIFSLLIPFMVARGMNINGIPMFVYAITGGMGIAISSILGLFPPWLPFFIIALGIIIAVIVYIYSGGSGGE